MVTDDKHIQLADFGLVMVGDSTYEHMTTSAGNAGTARWMSPERLNQSSEHRTTADDVYAFACVCYTVSIDMCALCDTLLISSAFHGSSSVL
jgi:serine/threonine protein kinase